MTKAAFDAWAAPFDAPAEQRSAGSLSPENPAVPLTSENLVSFIGLGGFTSSAGGIVTEEKALSVPAFWAAVNFLSGCLSGLPVGVYLKEVDKATKKERRVKVTGPISDLLNRAVNDETTSFLWRKGLFDQVFVAGRAYTYIERDESGKPINLWPLETTKTTCKRVNGKRVYQYRGAGPVQTYAAADIIDMAMMLKPDGVKHYSPVKLFRNIIGKALAVIDYGSKFFRNGGVPPFTISGPLQTAGAVDRAGKDLSQAVADASADGRLALALPSGHTITPIGVDPEKMQLVELLRFLIEEVARMFSLPMVFLQDLTRGTFSNTEQQDLHLVKHTIKRWVEQFEQELNLKLFGRGSPYYVRLNLDGLLRGDFPTRMEGYAKAIQNAVMKPNEARALEEREPDPDGDLLLIQGATVPVRNNINPKLPKEGKPQ